MTKPAAQPLNDKMIALMLEDATKTSKLTIKLFLKDGSIRKGIYLDLVENPLKRHEFKGRLFIVLEMTRDDHDIVYVPTTLVDTVSWSY